MEAEKTLAQLRDAALAVQRLADFLERNPNALITGRKPE
jgi:paraquat-inducible protein B